MPRRRRADRPRARIRGFGRPLDARTCSWRPPPAVRPRVRRRPPLELRGVGTPGTCDREPCRLPVAGQDRSAGSGASGRGVDRHPCPSAELESRPFMSAKTVLSGVETPDDLTKIPVDRSATNRGAVRMWAKEGRHDPAPTDNNRTCADGLRTRSSYRGQTIVVLIVYGLQRALGHYACMGRPIGIRPRHRRLDCRFLGTSSILARFESGTTLRDISKWSAGRCCRTDTRKYPCGYPAEPP